jgi:hypothetical protein
VIRNIRLPKATNFLTSNVTMGIQVYYVVIRVDLWALESRA